MWSPVGDAASGEQGTTTTAGEKSPESAESATSPPATSATTESAAGSSAPTATMAVTGSQAGPFAHWMSAVMAEHIADTTYNPWQQNGMEVGHLFYKYMHFRLGTSDYCLNFEKLENLMPFIRRYFVNEFLFLNYPYNKLVFR